MLRDPSLISSFGHAVRGIVETIRQERNMRVHVLAAIMVVAIGSTLKVTRIEWLSLIVCIALVMVLELLNAVMERVVDLVKPRLNPIVKEVKDIMAGAVLLAALAAVAIGGTIFIPRILAIATA